MTKRTLGQLRTQIHTGLLMSNDLELGGRRALVTGGTKGIGAAVAAPEEPVKQGSSSIKRRFFTSTWSRHLRVGLLTISLLMYGFPMSGASAEDTVRLESAYSFLDTLAQLRSALQGKGFTIFATIDHRAAALSVGLDMPPTTVLIYGNPKGGTALMLAAPDFALELPLRVLVREGGDGKTYVTFNPSTTLEGKHGLPAGMAEKLAPAEKVIAGAVGAPVGDE